MQGFPKEGKGRGLQGRVGSGTPVVWDSGRTTSIYGALALTRQAGSGGPHRGP